MSRDAQFQTINCTSCGAGLDVLGGGRVTTHICTYCGTALDTQNNYARLKKFDTANRPETPFKIGMTGKIWNVDWTLIGLLSYEENWDGATYRWVDHQLFSPTHGYAYLTLENGHTTLSRRYRGLGPRIWITPARVESAEKPPHIYADNARFTYYETSTSTLKYAEGEFTWTPERGDTTTTVTTMSKTAMIDLTQTNSEREAYLIHYLDPAETAQSFGLEATALRPSGFHPLTPYKAGKHKKFLRAACLALTAICLCIALFFAASPGTRALSPTSVNLAALPVELPFEITDTTRLTSLEMHAQLNNAWAEIPIEMQDPDGETLFEVGRVLERYSGVQGGERWSEGNNSATITFRAPIPGAYTLVISQPEIGTWGNSVKTLPRALRVSVNSSLSSSFWIALLAVFFALMSLWHLGREFLHDWRRWHKTDWTDDE